MQHFSCPTRLLDWTRSPWVALYFAVNHHFDKDGAVWSFLPSPLRREQKQASQRFVKRPFDSSHKANVFLMEEAIPTERLEAQQGVFTLATDPWLSHEDYLPCPRRIIIRAFHEIM